MSLLKRGKESKELDCADNSTESDEVVIDTIV